MIVLLVLTSLMLPLTVAGLTVDSFTHEALLDAMQVVPPTHSPGAAVVWLDYDIEEFQDPHPCSFWITYENLTGPPTGAYLHWGRAGENGPLAFTLVSGPVSSPHYGGADVPLDIVMELYHSADSLYVVIPTEAFPEGEVRGVFENITPPATEESSWGRIRGSYR